MVFRLSLAFAIALSTAAAFAHSKKEATTPSDGAQLTETPGLIQMQWDDPMRITMVRLVNAEGAEVALERATSMAPSREFSAKPAPLVPGQYTVEWRGLAADGHAMQGSFSFELTD